MLLQSLLRPVLTPIMRGIFDPAQSVSAAWSPLSLWPDGISSAGMWISPRTLTSQWADYTGTTPVAVPGTVADSANPVGLALDIRAGATVLTDPGNHMLQSTSAARPLMSARVNLLTYTENFEGGDWSGSGSTGADILDWSIGADKYQWLTLPANTPVRIEFDYSVDSGTDGTFSINLLGGASQNIDATPTVQRYSGVHSTGTTNPFFLFGKVSSGTAFRVSRMSVVREADGALPYQAILTDGSSYSSTGFPIAQLYDDVDDGMATAAFSAGTLIDGMECMIPVRWMQGGLPTILGLYQTDQTRHFGVLATATGDSTESFSECGSPTYLVDGVQLPGTTRGDLYDALSDYKWHILEVRALDLSAWVDAAWGTYQVNGARGDILLYPSTASTEDKDAARQWLADYYGVTLP